MRPISRSRRSVVTLLACPIIEHCTWASANAGRRAAHGAVNRIRLTPVLVLQE